MRNKASRSVWIFFLLLFALTVPFLALGALESVQLVPGVPLSALSVLCPAAAATLLTYRENGRRGVVAFLKRAFDFDRIKKKIWYLPLLLIMPAIMVLSFVATRALGTDIPLPRVTVAATLGLFAAFFVGALGEELGWSLYAAERLQERFGALTSALIIGAVGILWHILPLLQVGRSASFIVWWALGNGFAIRILNLWLYNNTGRCVFAAAVFHAMLNLTWQLYPVQGSYFDPSVTGPIMAMVAVFVVAIRGARTLTRS